MELDLAVGSFDKYQGRGLGLCPAQVEVEMSGRKSLSARFQELGERAPSF